MIRTGATYSQRLLDTSRGVVDMRRERGGATVASARDVRQWRWEHATGADVTIYGGEIQIGEQTPVAVADTTVTITANLQYVGWRYVKATKVLTIVNFGTSVSYTAGNIEKWLYLFSLIGGAVACVSDGTLNQVFPANFGDT